MHDRFGRAVEYLRISVTDRCNLQCVYCAPGGAPRLPREEILSYEELEKVAAIAVRLGLVRLRVTGGEPLLRKDLASFIRRLASLDGVRDLALTTNGTLLAAQARDLKEAGLRRVNISLDSLRGERYRWITGGGELASVLAGIEEALRVGLEPVKINALLLRGVNDDEAADFARLTLDSPLYVRFIELMPLGAGQRVGKDYLPGREIMARLAGVFGELVPARVSGAGPARYYALAGGKGVVGFITAMSECFCRSCNRLRLTADGRLRPCLASSHELAVREALRGPDAGAEVERLIARAVAEKPERHALHEFGGPDCRRMMRAIGG